MVDDFIDRKHGRKKVEYDAPVARADPQGHLRRHRLPGAGHADRAGAGAATRSAAPTCCAARWARRRPRRWRRRRPSFLDGAQGEGGRRARSPSGLRPDGELRGLRLQQSRTRRRTACSRTRPRTSSTTTRVEFFAALLTCDKDNIDKVVKFIAEARAMGIAVVRARHQRVGHRLHRRRARDGATRTAEAQEGRSASASAR